MSRANTEALPRAGMALTASGWLDTLFANRFVARIAHKAVFGAAMLLCLAWSAANALHPAAPESGPGLASLHDWPTEWDGRPLRQLPLSEVERRFADHFPGAIARMTDGRRVLVLRHVDAPTRMLHPAADCFRALGARIEQARLERDAQARLWRCFVTERAGAPKMRVCERIVDADGTAFTDTSAWYWAALGGRTHGPWQAVTLAQEID